MAKKKEIVDVAIVVSDASPILTLHRIGHLDVLALFAVPVHVVDQVHWEITKPENDPNGEIAAALKKLGNQITIIRTPTGVGFQKLREADPTYPSRNLGEMAVNEYVVGLQRTTGPRFVPLVLFEDPDVLDLKIAKLKGVHLLNTTAFLGALFKSGVLPRGQEFIEAINAARSTRMRPLDRSAGTKKNRSTWIRKVENVGR